MASIRQIFVLYIFVALLCHFGHCHKRNKHKVASIYELFENLLHPMDLNYLRFRQRHHHHPSRSIGSKSDDFINFPSDTPWDNSLFEESEESDDFLSNSIEYDDKHDKNSREADFKNPSSKRYGRNGNAHSNKNQNSDSLDKIQQPKRVIFNDNSNKSPESLVPNLLDIYSSYQALYDKNNAPPSSLSSFNPAPFVSKPGGPKTSPVIPNIVPSSVPTSVPIDVQNNDALYTRQLNSIFGNIPKTPLPSNNIPNTLLPNANRGITNGFNLLTIPNNENFGSNFRSNNIPTGVLPTNDYYQNPYKRGQQMYYLVKLSNGQVIPVPAQDIFRLNKGQKISPVYGPVLLPNNNQIFAPGPYLPLILYNDYMFGSNYGRRYVPGGLNFPQPWMLPYNIPPDYFEVLKGIQNNDQGELFFGQNMWPYGYLEPYGSSFNDKTVSLAAFKDETGLSSPEDKNEEVDDTETKNKEDKSNENEKYD